MATPAELTTLLDRNRSFAKQFEAGDLKGRPRLKTSILSCLDPRVDPAHIFQLELGDAAVLRTAGGRVTPGVMRDLAILGMLAAGAPGVGGGPALLLVIHHTDCGTARLAIPEVGEQFAKRLGVSNEVVAAIAVTDPAATVRADIEKLRQAPGAPDSLIVGGFVYHVTSGTIEQVVAAAPLRSPS